MCAVQNVYSNKIEPQMNYDYNIMTVNKTITCHTQNVTSQLFDQYGICEFIPYC